MVPPGGWPSPGSAHCQVITAPILAAQSCIGAGAASRKPSPLSGAPLPAARSASTALCGRLPPSALTLQHHSCSSLDFIHTDYAAVSNPNALTDSCVQHAEHDV